MFPQHVACSHWSLTPDCQIAKVPGVDVRPIMPTPTSVMVLGVALPLTNRDGVGPHWLPVSGLAWALSQMFRTAVIARLSDWAHIIDQDCWFCVHVGCHFKKNACTVYAKSMYDFLKR